MGLGINGSSRSLPSSPYTLESQPGPMAYLASPNPTAYSRARSDEFVRKSMFSIDDDDDEDVASPLGPNERNRIMSHPNRASNDGAKGEIASSILAKRRSNWEDTDYVGLVESYDSTWAERSAHSLS
jgi:hypothetical protein